MKRPLFALLMYFAVSIPLASVAQQRPSPTDEVSMIVGASRFQYEQTTMALTDAYIVLLKIANQKDAAEHLEQASKPYQAYLETPSNLRGTYEKQVPQVCTDLIAEGNHGLRTIAATVPQKHLNASQKKSLQRITRNVYISILKDEDILRANQQLQSKHMTTPGTPTAADSLTIAKRGPYQLATSRTLLQVLMLTMQNNNMSTDDLAKLQDSDGMQWGKTCYWEYGKPEPCDGDLSD